MPDGRRLLATARFRITLVDTMAKPLTRFMKSVAALIGANRPCTGRSASVLHQRGQSISGRRAGAALESRVAACSRDRSRCPKGLVDATLCTKPIRSDTVGVVV